MDTSMRDTVASRLVNTFALETRGSVRACRGQTVVCWRAGYFHTTTMFDAHGRVVFQCEDIDILTNWETLIEQAERAFRGLPTLCVKKYYDNLAECHIDGKCIGAYDTFFCVEDATKRCAEIAAMSYDAQWAIADAAK